MTNQELADYLRVCADLAEEKGGDRIAFVRSDLARMAADLICPAAEPKEPHEHSYTPWWNDNSGTEHRYCTCGHHQSRTVRAPGSPNA